MPFKAALCGTALCGTQNFNTMLFRFSLLLTIISLTTFAQTPDTLTPEKNARYKIGRIRDNTLRSTTSQDFRNAFNSVTNLALQRIPSLSMKDLRSGRADTAKAVEIVEGFRSGTFVYNPSSVEPDDSAMTIRNGTRRYERVVDAYVNVRWFGAKGDGITDDTEAIRKAINWIKAKGGGKVFFPLGTYYVTKQAGMEPIAAHDDGTVAAGHGTAMTPEPIFAQSYCIAIPSGVQLLGEGKSRSTIKSNYVYGNASLSEKIIFLATELYDYGIEGIGFKDCFMPFGAINTTIATSNFLDIQFTNCAFGIYARVLEQCTFRDIVSLATASPLLFGGQWHSRNDNYNELGGFVDKTTFANIRNNFDRILGTAEANIDKYFDKYFFKSVNNTTRLSTPIQAGTVVATSAQAYKGVCGFTILSYSRYLRQQNSNIFHLISHANSVRPAINFVNGTTCRMDIVYFENVGYHDNMGRTDGVGVGWTDPYLGTGVRIPALITGFDNTSYVSGVQAQFVFSGSITSSIVPGQAEKITGSNVTSPRTMTVQNAAAFTGNLTITGAITTSSTSTSNLSGTRLLSKTFSATAIDTGINTNAGNGGGGVLVIVSRNTGRGGATNTGMYLVNFGYDGNNSAPVFVSGTDIVDFSVDAKTGNLKIAGKTANNYKASFFVNF